MDGSPHLQTEAQTHPRSGHPTRLVEVERCAAVIGRGQFAQRGDHRAVDQCRPSTPASVVAPAGRRRSSPSAVQVGHRDAHRLIADRPRSPRDPPAPSGFWPGLMRSNHLGEMAGGRHAVLPGDRRPQGFAGSSPSQPDGESFHRVRTTRALPTLPAGRHSIRRAAAPRRAPPPRCGPAQTRQCTERRPGELDRLARQPLDKSYSKSSASGRNSGILHPARRQPITGRLGRGERLQRSAPPPGRSDRRVVQRHAFSLPISTT